MKAWVLEKIGTIKYKEVETPKIDEGEVLVSVQAAGVCGSDIPRIYQSGAHRMPLIPGHEFSGIVVKTGSHESNHWNHKRVGVFPLIPCKKCLACQNRQYEMCREYSYLGSRQDGGFAEYVAVPEWNLIELPDTVSYEQAAMLEPLAVACHAMRRIPINQNEKIVVCGLGTIGLLLLMLLGEKYPAENIYAVGNKDFQKIMAEKVGLKKENYCDSREIDVAAWIKDRTGNGANVFFECVGKNETYAQAIESMAPAGKICYLGNPNQDITFPKNVFWKILRNQLTITGTWNSSFGDIRDDWHEVLHMLERKQMNPEMFITHKIQMKELEQGLHVMRDKTEDYIKVMAVNESQQQERKAP